MRRIRSFIAMIFFASLFLIFFYSSLHLEMTHSHRTAPEGPVKHHTLQVLKGNVKTDLPGPKIMTTPLVDVDNISISKGLMEIIPLNGAYWNHLLATNLRRLKKGGTFRHTAAWSQCRETNEEILQTNMHDFTSYPDLFQTFVQGMNCRSPPVLISQPNKCNSNDGKKGTFLLFAIKSGPENFQRRQAVRETWGREHVDQSGLRVQTIFLLGRSSSLDDPDLAPLLSTEEQHHRDLLQWDFHESFLNLTLKMNVFLRWLQQNCSQVSFVFSGDDDVFVNTPVLLLYLQTLDASKASQLYAGHVIKAANPHRDPNSKYYIPPSFYDGTYPAYAGGGGFVFSGALLHQLHSVSHVIPFFPIDDVYMGVCFKALGVSPEAHKGFQTFDVSDKDREDMCVHKELILVHQRSPKQIKRLWRGIHSPFLTC